MSQEQTLLPQNPDLDVAPELAAFYPLISTLTNHQIKILAEIATDLVSGNKRTDEEIADFLGVHYKTVYNARQNPTFGTALGVITREIVKGKTDGIISDVVSAVKQDWRAGKWLMEYTGQFIQRSQQLSIHANMEGQAGPGDFQAFIEEFCIKIGAVGYPIEKVVETYQRLRAEGAF